MDEQSAQRTHELNEAIRLVFGAGALASALLLLVGLVMSVALGQPIPTVALTPAAALRQVAAFQAGGVVTLGLLALLATPFLMMLATLAVFIRQRDWPFVGVSLAILIIMAAGVAISSR